MEVNSCFGSYYVKNSIKVFLIEFLLLLKGIVYFIGFITWYSYFLIDLSYWFELLCLFCGVRYINWFHELVLVPRNPLHLLTLSKNLIND